MAKSRSPTARGRGTRPRKEYRGFPVGSIALGIESLNGLEVGLIFDVQQTVVTTAVDSPLVSMSTADGKILLEYQADGGALRYTHDEVNVGLGNEQFDTVQFGGGLVHAILRRAMCDVSISFGGPPNQCALNFMCCSKLLTIRSAESISSDGVTFRAACPSQLRGSDRQPPFLCFKGRRYIRPPVHVAST